MTLAERTASELAMFIASNPELPEGVSFRLLKAWPGYAVSSDGRVWSSRCRAGSGKASPWRPLVPGVDTGDYRHVSLYRSRVAVTKKVHHLILEAFIGPRPDGHEGCHRDGNKANNRIDNLRWDTKIGNAADSIANGVLVRGENHHSAKLTANDVKNIRREYIRGSANQGICGLANKYGVSNVMISKIIRGKSWRDLLKESP